MIIVTDRRKFIAYFPGDSIDIKVIPEEKIPQEDPILKAMDKKTHMTEIVSEEVYGIKYKSIMTPIFDEDVNVVGCICIGIPVENRKGHTSPTCAATKRWGLLAARC